MIIDAHADLAMYPAKQIAPAYYAQNHAFEQCSKNLPIMLNIMFLNLRKMPLLTGTKITFT